MAVCPLCDRKKPIIHEHHEIPRATGGTSGPTIFLCGECHEAVHTCARRVLSGKGIIAQDIAKATFKNQALAQDLIKSIVVHTLRKKEGKIPDKLLEYKMTLVLPGEVRRYIEVLSKDNRTSMMNYVTNLVLTHIKKKFPSVKFGEKNAK